MATMTTEQTKELAALRAENARLEAGLRAAVSTAQVREARQQIAMSLLQAENARLREALQFGLDNMHRWTGTSGPGSMEFIEKARAALAFQTPGGEMKPTTAPSLEEG